MVYEETVEGNTAAGAQWARSGLCGLRETGPPRIAAQV